VFRRFALATLVLFVLTMSVAPALGSHVDLGGVPETWVKEPGIRLEIDAQDPPSSVGVHTPYVVRFPGAVPEIPTYRMYYDPFGTYDMRSAVSADGLTWAKELGTRLTGAGHAHVLQIGPNLYRLYYEAVPGGVLQGIGSATSSDGVTWTVDPGLRLSGSYADPVVVEMGSFLRMYLRSGLNLYSATSTDGVTWSLEPGIRVSDAREFAAVRLPDGTFVLYYGQGTPAFAAILIARSADGLTFTKDPTPALTRGPPGSMDGGGVLTTSILAFPDGTVRMYYQGAPGADMNRDSRAFSAVGKLSQVAPCPRSHGFWKTHPAAWPVSALDLGDQTYTEAELLALLRAPSKGDASLIVARQLIAAKLNVANGSVEGPISATLAEADPLLSGFGTKLPHSVRPSTALGQRMVAAAGVLDDYNNGLLTPDCDSSDGEAPVPLTGVGGGSRGNPALSLAAVAVGLALVASRRRPTI